MQKNGELYESKMPDWTQGLPVKNINDLWLRQCAFWKWENEHWFGITPLKDWTHQKEVEKHLNECADRLWNNGTNELKKLLEDGGKCNDTDKMVPGSYELVYDTSGIICLYATFRWKAENRDGEQEEMERRSPLAYLPVPDDLCWWLNESRYVLRVTAVANYSMIYRQGDICYYQKAWTYNIKTGEWNVRLEDFKPYEQLTELNRDWLSCWVNCAPEDLTEELMVEAMKLLPEHESRALYRFRYTHVDEMFRLVRLSKRFANPLMKVPVPINIVKMFTAQRVRSDAVDRNGSNNLVLAQNELFALENSRTVIYKNEFNSNFMFVDTEVFFDAFKTSTNKSAGKSRLLLDHCIVHDGLLWSYITDSENKQHFVDMWDVAVHPEWTVPKNLSVLSSSNFASNNAPKRIMMTAKLRAQALPTKGESDPFTHETPARIVFGDWDGFNFGDSIVISRSFARKLRSHRKRKVHINHDQWLDLKSKYAVGDQMSVADLSELIGTTMCNNYRNIIVEALDPNFVSISAETPFSVGDKLTNLHGSKGIVSIILEDDEMPRIDHPVGNFPAGPFDIIVSGLSVYRRKSLGQLFEAWASATGHDDVDNILDAVERYSDDMKTFSEQSVVLFGQTATVKPIGINVILRLDHDAVSKQSHSYVKSNYARMLKFGEMELLNLAARGLYAIMNEIDVRSVSKHHNALPQIREMQRTGVCNVEPANSLRFFSLLRAVGFEFTLREPDGVSEYANQSFADQLRTLTDGRIDLFKGDNNEKDGELQ